MTPPTPEERAEAIANRLDDTNPPCAVKLIASAIREAAEAEQDNYDGLKSDLDSLLTAVIRRINGEKDMDSLAEYIRMNYPKQAQTIRPRSEQP